jgi:CheY-like chemotaxis protein
MASPPQAVVVVDDDADIRKLLRRMLGGGPYSVREARNGREAIELLESQPAALVIIDLLMPEQEGIETIRLLRNSHPSTKIIAISGAAGAFLKAAELVGADRVLEKPLSAKLLLSTVQELLNGHSMPHSVR